MITKDFEIELSMVRSNHSNETNGLRHEAIAICMDIDKPENRGQDLEHELDRYFRGQYEDFYVMARHAETGEVVGAMAMNSSFDTAQGHLKKGHIYINATVVKPEYQGIGVSRLMFEYLMEHLDGFKQVQTSIRAENARSRKSREKMGFTVTREWETDPEYDRDGKVVREGQKGFYMALNVEPTAATKRWQDAKKRKVKIEVKGKPWTGNPQQNDKKKTAREEFLHEHYKKPDADKSRKFHTHGR